MEGTFPFQLEDIQSWIIRRKDGTVVKYTLVNAAELAENKERKLTLTPARHMTYTQDYGKGFSAWCKHAPDPATQPPIFSNGKIALWIGDNPGAREVASKFDACIDGGAVLDLGYNESLPDVYGDAKLAAALKRYSYEDILKRAKAEKPAGPRILKIHWNDRAAPPVQTEFWPALLAELEKAQAKLDRPLKVMTICQGGHGRSGTAMVALMMCMTDYTPLDALTHIRALHCSRAIESKVQHEYLNKLAELLGREQNALAAEQVKSYKDRLLAEPQFEERFKAQLREGKGACSREREAGFL